MIVATALVAAFAFALGLRVTGALRAATGAATAARAALASVRDPRLDDDGRERAARQASGVLFRAGGSIAVRGLLSSAMLAMPVWASDAIGFARRDDVVAWLTSWQGVAVSAVVGAAAFLPTKTS